jgi:hypothetical protein
MLVMGKLESLVVVGLLLEEAQGVMFVKNDSFLFFDGMGQFVVVVVV